jgi:3-phenylpropionate/trans-cinnamate dioxygenase ferredoxin reductase subunit
MSLLETGVADRVVIVGAGLAAAHVATTLRDAGDTRPVTIVGNEGRRPYERPGLSKGVLQGEQKVDELFVHDDAWYAEHEVDARFDDAAVGLDLAAKRIRLSSGEALEYGDLVLAMGARPRMVDLPGAGLPGVHTLRRIEDCQALKEAFGRGGKLVVIGAGWIGLEVAAAARKAGLDVTVLEYAPVPLRAAMGDRMGQYFANLHERNGVDLRTGVRVTAIDGDAHVTGVRAGEELFPADLVVVGIGAEPNVELAKAAGLDVDNGVLVDDRLRAGDHVYAIGDVANAEHASLGRLRVEHWDNAIRQGQLAGHVLLGEDARYDWQPYFFTDQYDLGMEYVGRGSADDQVVVRGDEESGEFVVFWLRDGAVTAAMNVNVWDVNDQLRALIGRRIDVARLADAGVGLSDL